MATLYETIRHWADGQNAVNGGDAERRATLQTAVIAAMGSLRRYGSLADLAVAYYACDQRSRRVGEEFMLAADELKAVHDAAHWQRFMEIRHARKAQRK